MSRNSVSVKALAVVVLTLPLEPRARAEILARLEDKSMPCDGPWPEEQIKLFKRWVEEGMAP